MKFYSDVTNKLYETEEELNAAELAIKKAEAKKKAAEKARQEKETEAKKAAARDIKVFIDMRDKWVAAHEALNKIEDEIDIYIDKFAKKYANHPAVLLATQIALQKLIDGLEIDIDVELGD